MDGKPPPPVRPMSPPTVVTSEDQKPTSTSSVSWAREAPQRRTSGHLDWFARGSACAVVAYAGVHLLPQVVGSSELEVTPAVLVAPIEEVSEPKPVPTDAEAPAAVPRPSRQANTKPPRTPKKAVFTGGETRLPLEQPTETPANPEEEPVQAAPDLKMRDIDELRAELMRRAQGRCADDGKYMSLVLKLERGPRLQAKELGALVAQAQALLRASEACLAKAKNSKK